jgi:hypothetical protein
VIHLFHHRLGRLDKLLLSLAYLAVVAYLWISVEVTAADQPEQLVDVVGSNVNVTRHPNHRFEHLVVTSPPGRQLKGPEDVLDVRVGLGEVLVPSSLTKLHASANPNPSISCASSIGRAGLARSSSLSKVGLLVLRVGFVR